MGGKDVKWVEYMCELHDGKILLLVFKDPCTTLVLLDTCNKTLNFTDVQSQIACVSKVDMNKIIVSTETEFQFFPIENITMLRNCLLQLKHTISNVQKV